MSRHRYTRTMVVGVLSAVIALSTMLSARGAPAEPAAFGNGRASAVAQVTRYAPGVGSLQLGITTGQSVSQVQNSLAQAQAQSLDLGLIGTSLTAEQCDGSPGYAKPEQLPQPTRADNRSGNATATVDEFPIAGTTLGGGRQEASATTDPSAHAAVSTAQSVLGPLATISSGRSDAVTRVVDAKAREAEATVSVDLDIAGVVHLRDARWRAFHRTGADPKVDGTFAVASATAGDVALPSDQTGPLQDALNSALAPSGVTIELPRTEHLTSPIDLVRVTPLRITMKDSPAGKAALGPGLNLTRAEREQLFNTIVGAYCKAATPLLVGDITVSVLSGTGFMTIEVGGAEATSADSIEGNPFGSDAPFNLPEKVATPGATTGGNLPVTGVVGTASTATARPAADVGPFQELCESLHPTRHPLCSRGMGVPLGIGGLVATSGIGYLDWRRQRRHATGAGA